jgi:hypothetical protein
MNNKTELEYLQEAYQQVEEGFGKRLQAGAQGMMAKAGAHVGNLSNKMQGIQSKRHPQAAAYTTKFKSLADSHSNEVINDFVQSGLLKPEAKDAAITELSDMLVKFITNKQ